jgi:hypothetical protein
VAALLAPVHESVARLTTIPGVSHLRRARAGRRGRVLGTTRFPSSAHLRSWAVLGPRLDESAGKRRSTRLRLGAPWLKTTLMQAAWAAVKVKQLLADSQADRAFVSELCAAYGDPGRGRAAAWRKTVEKSSSRSRIAALMTVCPRWVIRHRRRGIFATKRRRRVAQGPSAILHRDRARRRGPGTRQPRPQHTVCRPRRSDRYHPVRGAGLP